MARGRAEAAVRLAGLGALLLAAGCAGARVEDGVFRSPKGYRVSLPPEWRPAADGDADLTLRRGTSTAGMLVDATCDGAARRRPSALLARHLTFGLTDRQAVVREAIEVKGRRGARTALRGRIDGVEVAVEAVVVEDARCVFDFLYLAPPPEFAAGQPAFRAFVESLTPDGGAEAR